MNNALIVIDIQNDYFPGGAFTLENAEAACQAAVEAIEQARRDGWLVVGVQHLNPPLASALGSGTKGADLHPAIAAALGDAPVIPKHQADSFFDTGLEPILRDADITDIYLTGMMTQHCVTHTALSPQAQGMRVHIIAKGCAAPTQGLSDIALRGLSARCRLV
ncbi:isochorismatase [Zobellella endophytica]|uniref:Isochorismatase n=1 Tax=Zobellella endophytica TaxID=2116700 RepID=A0A2P7RAZ8_9GAMM|nr:isochorismatase family protein [Zobellella endophytica]PSJ47418.1 isochorismatase [Zobellella endophytica]